MAFSLGRPRQGPRPARVVQRDLEEIARPELRQHDFRLGPAERAGDTAEIESVASGHELRSTRAWGSRRMPVNVGEHRNRRAGRTARVPGVWHCPRWVNTRGVARLTGLPTPEIVYR